MTENKKYGIIFLYKGDDFTDKEKYDFYIGLYINNSVELRKINQFSVSKDSPPNKLLCAVSKFASQIRVTVGFSMYSEFGEPSNQTLNVAISSIPVWQAYKNGDMYIGTVEASNEYTGLAVLKKA